MGESSMLQIMIAWVQWFTIINSQTYLQLIRLSMRSSLSFYDSKTNQGPQMSNFHKDVITPHIYADENFQYIKNNSYPARHQRKVVAVKKKRVSEVVEAIVTKKNIETSKKIANYQHRLSRPTITQKRNQMQVHTLLPSDQLEMDIDQKINERAFYHEEQTASAKERVKEVMGKINNISKKGFNVDEQMVFYITQISPQKKPSPLKIDDLYILANKQVKLDDKGYVEEQEQIQNRRNLRNRKQLVTQTQLTIKHRPKTADNSSKSKTVSKNKNISRQKSVFFRSNSLMNTRLSRFETGIETTENLKRTTKNEKQKQSMKTLFQAIQDNCHSSIQNKSSLIDNLNKMGMLWKSQKQFLENQNNRHVLSISEDTLSLLKSIRRKSAQMANLDNKFIKLETKNRQ